MIVNDTEEQKLYQGARERIHFTYRKVQFNLITDNFSYLFGGYHLKNYKVLF